MSEDTTVQELKQELERLRDEQRRLRDEQQRQRDGHDGNGHKNGDSGRSDDDRPKDPPKAPEQEAPKPPKAPLRQRIRTFAARHPLGILLGAVGVVILIVAAIFLTRYLNSYESTDDAQVDGHLNPITPRISGTVTGVYTENNAFVTAGQLLADLDPRDYQVALERAKAAYAQAGAQERAENPNVPIIQTTTQTSISTGQADVTVALNAVSAAEKDYEAKQASVREAEAQNAKAQRDVQRFEPLVMKEEISQQQFDAYVAAARTQAAAVDAAIAAAQASQQTVNQRRAQVEQTRTRLAEAQRNAPQQLAAQRASVESRQANVVAAKAAVDQALLQLSYTKIVAPVNGVVTNRTVEVGQHVQAGEDLLSLSQTSDLWVTANFKENQLKRMRAGQSVDLKVDAFGTVYQGYVDSLPGATGARTSLLPPENATGNYVKVVQRLPVRIRFKPGQDAEHRLRIGLSVEPKVWLFSNSS